MESFKILEKIGILQNYQKKASKIFCEKSPTKYQTSDRSLKKEVITSFLIKSLKIHFKNQNHLYYQEKKIQFIAFKFYWSTLAKIVKKFPAASFFK